MSIPQPAGSAEKKSLLEYARDDNQVPDFPGARDKNWYRGDVSAAKWDKSFPYQLRILVAEEDGYRTAEVKGAVFTLPIPPEALSVSTPFAISTAITLGGSIEEHNGAPIRMISLSGSFGVAPGKASGVGAKTLSFAQSIFAGTITAAQNTKTSFSQLMGTEEPVLNVHSAAEFEDLRDQGKLTGYYQSRLLQGFLESYVELKKSSAKYNRLYRLAFCMWKDEQVYLVTPVSYESRKSAASPLEYLYSLNLKATKRIKLNSGISQLPHSYTPIQRDPNRMAQFLRSLEQARVVLQNSRKTITAIGGDLGANLFGTMRELTLYVKDALAVPLSVADLSDSIIQDVRRSIVDLSSTGNAVANFPTNMQDRFGASFSESVLFEGQLRSLSGEASDDPLVDRSIHPAYQAFESPTDNYSSFRGIQVGDLNLPPTVASKIAGERMRVSSMTRLDFEQRRDQLELSIAEYSRALGLSHGTYERTVGLESTTTKAIDTPSDDDFEALFVLNRLLQDLNKLVVTNSNDPRSKIDAIASVAGLAERSGIAFRMPRSKFAVPFPYGSTLEMLAAKYLGTPDRWHEIVALNGLRAPYVDEAGFDLPLLVNGVGNNVIVEDVSKLFVGQSVWLLSSTTSRMKRRIKVISKLTQGQYMVVLDGDADLHRFTTLANARLFAFLPNTVNSQQLIFIPSDQDASDDDFVSTNIPGQETYDPLLAVGGADLLLTQKNDLVITPDGDTRWAVGMVNMVQKTRLAFSIRKGSLNRHPEIGFPLQPGSSIADLETSDVIRSIEAMFRDDPSFDGIQQAQIRVNGPVAALGVGIGIRGTNQLIPISVELKQ